MAASNWTVRNILKGKTILFILMTLILTKVFNDLANKGLNIYLNQFNDHPIYTHNYSFGKYGLLLIIPAAMITILILKLYVKIRNVPYQNENDLSPARLKNLGNKVGLVLTSKITKYVFISIGTIIFIMFLIEFINVITVFFPNIEKTIVRRATMPVIGFIFAIYFGSIILMASAAFSKKPMKVLSKYSARFGLLALIFLLFGFGAIFAVLGIICSLFGMIHDHGEGRKTAICGFVSSFMTLLVLGGIATVGYLSITGAISL